MDSEIWHKEIFRRKHVRSPSEIGICIWGPVILAMLEKSYKSDVLEKKTVIVMIGLPVKIWTVNYQ